MVSATCIQDTDVSTFTPAAYLNLLGWRRMLEESFSRTVGVPQRLCQRLLGCLGKKGLVSVNAMSNNLRISEYSLSTARVSELPTPVLPLRLSSQHCPLIPPRGLPCDAGPYCACANPSIGTRTM